MRTKLFLILVILLPLFAQIQDDSKLFPKSDFTYDGKVGYPDFSEINNKWLLADNSWKGDYNKDLIINEEDLVTFSDDWLDNGSMPAPADYILRFATISPTSNVGRRNVYYTFSVSDYTIVANDYLEYSIYVEGDSPDIVGCIDMVYTDGSCFRNAHIKDQDNLDSHPYSNLDPYANERWYGRRILLNSFAGKTIAEIQIAFATDVAAEGEYVIYFDNVRIVNDGNLKVSFFDEQEPAFKQLETNAMLSDFSLERTTVENIGESLPEIPVPVVNVLSNQSVTAVDDGFVEVPAICSNETGQAWSVWLSRQLGDSQNRDKIMLSSLQGDNWINQSLTPLGYYEAPDIACGANDSPMAVWVARVGDNWQIQSSIFDGSQFTQPSPITSTSYRAAHPALIACENGKYWLAWEAYSQGKFSIKVSYYDNIWSQEFEVTDGSFNCYDPSLAVDSQNNIWIAYSKVENSEKNIYVKKLNSNLTFDDEIVISINGARTYQAAHPTITCDTQDRLWIGYERSIDTKKQDCYFGQYETRVVCYDDGKFYEVAPQEVYYNGKVVQNNSNYHFPLLYNNNGKLWVFSREGQLERRAWKVVASSLNGADGWSKTVNVLNEDAQIGRMQPTAITKADESSVWIAYQGDNDKSASVNNVISDLYIAKVQLPASKPLIHSVLKATQRGTHSDVDLGRQHLSRPTVTVSDKTYTYLTGNLHEHTDISGCWSDNSDGDLDDNYRYGLDVEKYDFVSITDHGYNLHKAAWIRSIRSLDFYNDSDGAYITLPAYEFTPSAPTKPAGSGHRNVVFKSSEDAITFLGSSNSTYDRHYTNCMPTTLWDMFKDKNIPALTIPHHTADKDHPMDWDYHDDDYQRVVEIYQCRLSCEYKGCPSETYNPTDIEGCYVRDGLQRGYKMGFVASGDHNAMGKGLAIVLAEDVSPEGVYEAMNDRRCYATTGDKIILDFRVNGAVMGSEITSFLKPIITASIQATAPLKEVVVFRNDEICYSKDVIELASATNWDIDLLETGYDSDCYYYLRAIQTNNQIAWSSPIWVSKP